MADGFPAFLLSSFLVAFSWTWWVYEQDFMSLGFSIYITLLWIMITIMVSIDYAER